MTFRISVQVKPQARKNSILKLSERESSFCTCCAGGGKGQRSGGPTAGDLFLCPKVLCEASTRSIFAKKAIRDWLTTPKRLKPSFRQLRLPKPCITERAPSHGSANIKRQ